MTTKRCYIGGEEIANTITHGIGVGLSIAALVLLVVRASFRAPEGLIAPYVVGCSLFGASLILLYLMSTLYHVAPVSKAKRFFAVLDHSAIYVLIAGTYTGFCLTVLYGPLGWLILTAIWLLALFGVTLYCVNRERTKWISFSLYLIMGWMIVLVGGELQTTLPPAAWYLLVVGGLAYTFGCVFFLMHRVPWMHSIWHLFVLGGSLSHFFALYVSMA